MPPTDNDFKKLLIIAKEESKVWEKSGYYKMAEDYMDQQWETCIWPTIKDADFSCVVDLAAGQGRNSEKLKGVSKKIIIVDVNKTNINYCKRRFTGDDRFTFIKNDGVGLKEIDSNAVSLIYCWDAMVHFDSDIVRSYLREFYRVLKPGGRGFCHHSNYTANPGGSYLENAGWRNFMSQQLFHHYCAKEGLSVAWSLVIDWEVPALDCLTLFEKPVDAPKTAEAPLSRTKGSFFRRALRKVRSMLTTYLHQMFGPESGESRCLFLK